MKYSVTYGVNNSHLTECEFFNLYRDAVTFFNNLEQIYPSAVVYKMSYDKAGYVVNREPKLHKSEKGRDNTAFLNAVIREALA